MRIADWFSSRPAPPGFGTGRVVPEERANPLSRLVFHWITPLLSVGFSRPLEKDDLWHLPEHMETKSATDLFETKFYSRCPPGERPSHLQQRDGADNDNTNDTADSESTASTSKYDKSIMKALHRTFIWRFWLCGVLLFIGDTLRTTTPLVTKELLTWLVESYVWAHLDEEQQAAGLAPRPRGVGYGIGLGFVVFAMQELGSLFVNHSNHLGMTLGLAARTTVIGSIFRKSLRLSGRARLEHSVGQITTMISTDATRIDQFLYLAHTLWIAPVQIILGIGLLINNLGYSALVGVAVFVFSLPVQGGIAWVLFSLRDRTAKVTDGRVRLMTEVLQGVRLIKFYAWEAFYSHRIAGFREKEIALLKKSAIATSALIALIGFVPVLASVLSFITYGLTGHSLNVAIIFSSLQFFNVIRAPLTMLPLVLAFFADSLVALRRISTFLTAEDLSVPHSIEPASDFAIKVDGTFTWERSKAEEEKAVKPVEEKPKPKGTDSSILPVTSEKQAEDVELKPEEEIPFQLADLHLEIPKGSFVAIVGRVGSGKSSILQALIGEMRKLDGEVILGGQLAYAPQTPWIRNCTLRENILFGQPDDPAKYDQIVKACCLAADIEMLPNGDLTEIGEKGINLSGGQKARVSLARAIYSPSEIVLLDDPLSAVDAYVGKSILDNCLLRGPLAAKTRILVTHSLHVLDKTDYIYVVDGGVVKEQGSYTDLIEQGEVFSKLIDDYGRLEHTDNASSSQENDIARKPEDLNEKKDDALMQEEERVTGAVTWKTYRDYLRFAGSTLWGPALLVVLILNECSSVANNIFLGFWTSEKIDGFTQGQYMGVYAGLGVAQAVFSYLINFMFTIAALLAGLRIYRASLAHILGSPTSFFDTTPIGRILSRLSKDQDTVDAELALTISQFLIMFSATLGTVALVFYTFPFLGIIFAPLTVLYYIVQVYYRRTSIETKRLDSLMRSALYASYSETLTGLSTIRAYGEQKRCIQDAEQGLDLENRAYYMTIALQRWLSVRLDMFGNVLVLGIVLFAAGYRKSIDPSKTGVVLSYTMSITSVFSEMINQFARNEQNMNAVERILVYTQLPIENTPDESEHPDASWPQQGKITFTGVDFAYREGLPFVLKGVSFNIKAGEKIGIIGRTGAGKSSLLQALFRIADVQAGSIAIDGVDISKTNLNVLRTRLALVPQETTMFLGTLRQNLDPHGSRTDAELISVLQRAWLLPSQESPDAGADARFSLDANVGDEGSNFSTGERQLLALARALVKNSRIIVLDEATSSVDAETDAKVQRTIRSEFASSTLLCIAHRLNTIAYYDRILVMDAGQVAEFDTVLNLFDREDSIFRSLCNEARLQKADILRIRADQT